MKLCVTYCSGKKHPKPLPPDKLYDSERINKFTEYCKSNNLNWAIFSAKYGLFFPEENKEPYDVTLRTDYRYPFAIRFLVNGKMLSKEESYVKLRELSNKIKTQLNDRSVDEIIFYTWSLKQSRCYLVILHIIFDSCEKIHSWQDLLECIKQGNKISVRTQLDFAAMT